MPLIVHCDRVSHKMAEFSFARCVFTVCICHIFSGLESQLEVSEPIHAFFVFLSFRKRIFTGVFLLKRIFFPV